jgi:hypothetical protein
MNPIEGSEVLGNAKAIMREHVALCQNFALLAKLEEGQKLRVQSDNLAIDTSILPCFQRWLYKQDRVIVSDKVRSLVERGQACLKTLLGAYTSLREMAYYPGSQEGRPSVSACETEFHLRQLVNSLYDHMLKSVQGLQKLTRTYATDAVYSTTFEQIGTDTLAFLQRFNLIWSYQHEQLKSHSLPYSASESRPEWNPTGQDFVPVKVAAPTGLAPATRIPVGKPPPIDLGAASQLYVPIGRME